MFCVVSGTTDPCHAPTPRTFFRRKLNGGDDDRAGEVRATAGSPPEASLPYPLFVSAGAVVGRRREIDTTDASGNDGKPFGYSDRREYE